MRGRHGENRADRREGEHPGGRKAQESYAPRIGLNSRHAVADRCGDQTPVGEEALGAISTARSVRKKLPASVRVAPARKGLRSPKRTDGSNGAIASEGSNGGARIDGASASVRRAPAGEPTAPSGVPRRASWVPTRRGLRTSTGADTLPISEEVFGQPRSPKGSSDFGGTRCDLRNAEGRAARSESAGSSDCAGVERVVSSWGGFGRRGARWGARRKRRGLRATAWKAGQTEPTGPSGTGSEGCSSGVNGASVSRALGCGLRIFGAASAVAESERNRSNRLGPSGADKAGERFGRREPSGSRRASRCPSHVALRNRETRAGRLIRRGFGSGGSSGRSVRPDGAFGYRAGGLERTEGTKRLRSRTVGCPDGSGGPSGNPEWARLGTKALRRRRVG
jgi:hypothetical protein